MVQPEDCLQLDVVGVLQILEVVVAGEARVERLRDREEELLTVCRNFAEVRLDLSELALVQRPWLLGLLLRVRVKQVEKQVVRLVVQ